MRRLIVLQITTMTANVLVALGVGLLGGSTTACGLSAVQVRERELCYERAEAAAQARVDAECAESFTDCATADAILTELRTAQEACP
jgi:hypothetical protein